MVSHWSLSDSKSPQVSRTLLSILADFNNAVVCMVSTRPLIFKSSSPWTSLLVTVPRAPITISITVTFIFHSFFRPLARSKYLSLFSLSFNFILWSAATAKSTILQVLFFFFLLIISKSGRDYRIVCISKSQKSLCVSFFGTDSGLCIYHLFAWSHYYYYCYYCLFYEYDNLLLLFLHNRTNEISCHQIIYRIYWIKTVQLKPTRYMKTLPVLDCTIKFNIVKKLKWSQIRMSSYCKTHAHTHTHTHMYMGEGNYESQNMMKINCWTKEANWYIRVDMLISLESFAPWLIPY